MPKLGNWWIAYPIALFPGPIATGIVAPFAEYTSKPNQFEGSVDIVASIPNSVMMMLFFGSFVGAIPALIWLTAAAALRVQRGVHSYAWNVPLGLALGATSWLVFPHPVELSFLDIAMVVSGGLGAIAATYFLKSDEQRQSGD